MYSRSHVRMGSHAECRLLSTRCRQQLGIPYLSHSQPHGVGNESLLDGGNDKLWGDGQTGADLGGQYHGRSNFLVKGLVTNETAWKEAA